MFIDNPDSLDVSLAHGRVAEHFAVAAVIVSSTYRVEGDRLVPPVEPVSRRETDPPADVSRFTLWSGASVTAAGVAAGPAAAPFVCPVLFRIGSVERRLIVFGDRRWVRRFDGTLQATAPAPFERIELSFARAFGGGYDVPPGLLPGTDLPHPGVRVVYPLNERGVGYYADERAATDAPLPNVERPDQLLRSWDDRPEPAGFTPCRDLVFWRMRDEMTALAHRGAQGEPAVLGGLPPPLRVQHHAPPSLIFDDLAPGTPVELHGLSEPVRFAVPPSPAAVSVRVGKGKTAAPPRLRALHVDAERRVARLLYDHTFRYDPRRAPSWIRVATSTGAS